MNESIVTDPNEIKGYIDQIRRLADTDKSALGFLPASAYHEAGMRGHLWIAIGNDRKLHGYLFFGSRYPRLRVVQLYVHPDFRRSGTARALIGELVKYGEDHDYLTISAKVAVDLEANSFWKAAGFNATRRTASAPGKRSLNVYICDLDVPSLIRDQKDQAPALADSKFIRYPTPIFPTPSYVIDLNVFLDVVRSRDHGEASLLLSLGFDSEIRLCVTSEFAEELQRSATVGSPDPVLEFAKSLPTLPTLDPGAVKPLIEALRTVLRPGTQKTGKRAVNDASDLIHLASSIQHRAYGFITRDAVILQRAATIYQEYRLRVVSPADFSDLFDGDAGRQHPQRAIVGRHEIEIADLDERNRTEAEDFLHRLGVDPHTTSFCLASGTSRRSRSRRIARTAGRMVGVGSWANAGLGGTVNLYLYIDEDDEVLGNSESVIDRFLLESCMNAGTYGKLLRLDLAIAQQQEKTREVAISIGFRPPERQDQNPNVALTKITFKGVVDVRNWLSFRRAFREMTNYTLQETMPSWNRITNTGIVMEPNEAGRIFTISPFDFETLASPCALLYPGRNAVIVPIREGYANELLPSTQRQKSFFPRREVEFRLEKAYFFAAKKHTLVPRGTIVVFYVSGPRSEAIALARVTFSDTMTRTQALLHLGRGVLTEEELDERKSGKNEISAFTFDNVLLFQKNIAYGELKRAGCIDGRNLQTVQPLSHEKLRWLSDRAFQDEMNR